jgi:hypothetical protein
MEQYKKMKSIIFNRVSFLFVMVILILTNSIIAFSQRKSELPSIGSSVYQTPKYSINYFLLKNDPIMSNDVRESIILHRSIVVLEKIGLGGLLGIVAIFPGAMIGGRITEKKDETWSAFSGALIGGYLGYMFGSSYGVHLVSLNENPESDYWLILLSGFIGVGIGGAVSAITHNGTVGTWLAFSVPITFPIIYTELIE